jgi:hypothetical protein
MVPKVAGKGSSFKGAALYYLHDKGALTSDRVAFSQTENLPTQDAEKAIKCMAWTAIHQSDIKVRAGGSAKGRKLVHPVYTYSLSWAPDEEPTPEQMIEAARESLRALGLEGHETLFVAHNDEPHPHIHVIVNRVHPDTGIAAPLSNDHLKLSAWAEEYEKRQGKIRCEQRVENNARRRKKQFVKDHFSQKAADFHFWRRMRMQEAFRRRQEQQKELTAVQQQQRRTLYEAKEKQIRDERRQHRKDDRSRWRQLYVHQQLERDKLQLAQRNAWARLRYFLQTQARTYFSKEKAGRSGFLSAGFAAIVGGPRQFADLDKKQRKQRVTVAEAIKNRQHDGFRKINANYKTALDKLIAAQRQEQAALEQRQAEESRRQAQEIKVPPRESEAARRPRVEKTYRDFGHQARDVTKPKSPNVKAFEKAHRTEEGERLHGQALRNRLRQKMADKRYKEISEQAEDITKPKARPTPDFKRVRGEAAPAPEKTGNATKDRLRKKMAALREREAGQEKSEATEKQERVNRTYKAFRELADEVSNERKPGGGRTINRKPPKGPEFR